MTDTPDWVRDAVFYQIVPDRFAASSAVPKPGPLEPWDARPTTYGFKGGDLVGIAERLPELIDLGITALYLTPVFASASNHRYHTYDYLHVDPLLGGDDALRALLDRCHALGVRVVLDGVFNHTGRGFWPFHHVLENGIDSPYVDWFHVDRERLRSGGGLDAYPGRGGDALARAGSGQGDGSLGRFGYVAWWDLPALPKLNTSHPEVREYLLGVAEHWLQFGADGWRLDVPTEIEDPGFWREFRERCRAIDPDAYLVGEIWHEAPDWLAGDRFDATMNYPLGAAILGFAGGVHLDRRVIQAHDQYRQTIVGLDGLAFGNRIVSLTQAYEPAVRDVELNLIGSHDTPRALSVCGGDADAVRLAILALATLPGAPCIYYGDEIGMTGGNDPECRGAYPADPIAGDRSLRAFVRDCLRLRAATPALRAGPVDVIAASGSAIAYRRGGEEGDALVVVNAGEAECVLDVSGGPGLGDGGWSPAMLGDWPPLRLETADSRSNASVRVPGRRGGVLRRGG